MLMMLLFKVALHDFLLTSACVCQDAKLLVHVSLLLEPVNALGPHSHQHLVGQFDIAPSKLFQALGRLMTCTMRLSYICKVEYDY